MVGACVISLRAELMLGGNLDDSQLGPGRVVEGATIVGLRPVYSEPRCPSRHERVSFGFMYANEVNF